MFYSMITFFYLLPAANSVIRRMLGNLAQDPHDENFEEGAIDITEPVYGPTIELMNLVYGETRTVVVSWSSIFSGLVV